MQGSETRLWGVSGDVQDLIGLECTLKLMQAYRKKQQKPNSPTAHHLCRIYVPTPKRININSKLTKTIGYENTLKLAQAFGGKELSLPKTTANLLNMRNKMIAEMLKISNAQEISEVLNITIRSIYAIQESYQKD